MGASGSRHAAAGPSAGPYGWEDENVAPKYHQVTPVPMPSERVLGFDGIILPLMRGTAHGACTAHPQSWSPQTCLQVTEHDPMAGWSNVQGPGDHRSLHAHPLFGAPLSLIAAGLRPPSRTLSSVHSCVGHLQGLSTTAQYVLQVVKTSTAARSCNGSGRIAANLALLAASMATPGTEQPLDVATPAGSMLYGYGLHALPLPPGRCVCMTLHLRRRAFWQPHTAPHVCSQQVLQVQHVLLLTMLTCNLSEGRQNNGQWPARLGGSSV